MTLITRPLHKQWNMHTEILSVVNEEAKLSEARLLCHTGKFCVKKRRLTLSDSFIWNHYWSRMKNSNPDTSTKHFQSQGSVRLPQESVRQSSLHPRNPTTLTWIRQCHQSLGHSKLTKRSFKYYLIIDICITVYCLRYLKLHKNNLFQIQMTKKYILSADFGQNNLLGLKKNNNNNCVFKLSLCHYFGFQEGEKQEQRWFDYLETQTSLRPFPSTWFSESIIQTDVHKILSRRASHFASPKCSPWNKQMRTDNPCDSPYVPTTRTQPGRLVPTPMDIIQTPGAFSFLKEKTLTYCHKSNVSPKIQK